MEKRINNKIEDYIVEFKTDIKSFINQYVNDTSTNNKLNNYIDSYNKLILKKEDFVKRKRVKNVVPMYERCMAKRANNERCSRRKKQGEDFCGTHIKGQPHGIVTDNDDKPSYKKITVKTQDIKGIIYYIDEFNNVYDHNDILNGIKDPKVIAKYKYKNNEYSIPEFE